MSEPTITGRRSSRRGRNTEPTPDGETAESAAAEQTEQTETAETAETAEPTPAAETAPEITPEMVANFSAAPVDFRNTVAPTRARKPAQLAMDKIAADTYADWIKAGRPSVWNRMPVVTYFLDPPMVPGYRKLIRRACDYVTPEGDANGVRVRFGTEVTLTDVLAEKIHQPDQVGKVVLAWCAIDKRNRNTGDAAAAAAPNGDDDDDDDDDE